MRSLARTSAVVAGVRTGAPAQQRASDAFRPVMASPTFPRGTGPLVAIDRAHRNFHPATGRYAPFAAILRADGYRVSEIAERSRLRACVTCGCW